MQYCDHFAMLGSMTFYYLLFANIFLDIIEKGLQNLFIN
jgi:hypothetical protein